MPAVESTIHINRTLQDTFNTLERGEAVLAPENWWEYKPAAQGSLLVQAFDLPGNVAKANAAAQYSSS